ncbi:MAG TPA: hypothetical protein VGI57_00895 [Usitatibacter sp.]
MKKRIRHSTPLLIAALACLVFGFVPLLVVLITAGMEFAWLFATDPGALGWPHASIATLASNAFNLAANDWASLYMVDGQYDMRLFTAQVVCAVIWCVYMSRMRWKLGQR